jgi:hypothetical protein
VRENTGGVLDDALAEGVSEVKKVGGTAMVAAGAAWVMVAVGKVVVETASGRAGKGQHPRVAPAAAERIISRTSTTPIAARTIRSAIAQTPYITGPHLA